MIVGACNLQSTVRGVQSWITKAKGIAELLWTSMAVIADFECEDEIILELIFGAFNPSGKLPLEFSSSKQAVENQKEDVPYDSEDPLYKYGHGLSYEK